MALHCVMEKGFTGKVVLSSEDFSRHDVPFELWEKIGLLRGDRSGPEILFEPPHKSFMVQMYL